MSGRNFGIASFGGWVEGTSDQVPAVGCTNVDETAKVAQLIRWNPKAARPRQRQLDPNTRRMGGGLHFDGATSVMGGDRQHRVAIRVVRVPDPAMQIAFEAVDKSFDARDSVEFDRTSEQVDTD
jgi:hypothetical protein